MGSYDSEKLASELDPKQVPDEQRRSDASPHADRGDAASNAHAVSNADVGQGAMMFLTPS